MDISITIPTSRWANPDAPTFNDIKRIVEEGEEQTIYFRLAWLPKQDKRIKRCYLIYKGRIRGSFRVQGFLNVMQGSNELLRGRYVILNVPTWKEQTPLIKAKGHRNFQYMEGIEEIQENGKNIFVQMYEELERRCQTKPH